MQYKKTLTVKNDEAEQLEHFCHEAPGSCGRDEPIFDEEVVFDNGKRMAIQVIASTEPDKEPCWTQGVVFDSMGNEMGCTDVGDSFLGEYSVFDGEDEYVVDVVKASPAVKGWPSRRTDKETETRRIPPESAAFELIKLVNECDGDTLAALYEYAFNKVKDGSATYVGETDNDHAYIEYEVDPN
jgi:hypothetical protein